MSILNITIEKLILRTEIITKKNSEGEVIGTEEYALV